MKRDFGRRRHRSLCHPASETQRGLSCARTVKIQFWDHAHFALKEQLRFLVAITFVKMAKTVPANAQAFGSTTESNFWSQWKLQQTPYFFVWTLTCADQWPRSPLDSGSVVWLCLESEWKASTFYAVSGCTAWVNKLLHCHAIGIDNFFDWFDISWRVTQSESQQTTQWISTKSITWQRICHFAAYSCDQSLQTRITLKTTIPCSLHLQNMPHHSVQYCTRARQSPVSDLGVCEKLTQESGKRFRPWVTIPWSFKLRVCVCVCLRVRVFHSVSSHRGCVVL